MIWTKARQLLGEEEAYKFQFSSTDYVRMKKYGESFEFKCVNCSSNTVLYFLHEISFYFNHITTNISVHMQLPALVTFP
jgi:hypothetical protein